MAKASNKPKFIIEIAGNSGDVVIGFNNSVAPLGSRGDLSLLMDIGMRSNDQTILKHFKVIPTTGEWQDYMAEEFNNNE